MAPQSNPNNPHHAAIQSKLLHKLSKLNVIILPSLTYHDILPENLTKKLQDSGNHLARVIRHLPDVHILTKTNKLIGIDIKTNPDRNICIEILPILEKIHAQEKEVNDLFYIYHHKELMKEPKIIPINKNIPTPMEVCISTNSNYQYRLAAKQLKKLLKIYYPEVKIKYKDGIYDSYALWSCEWINKMLDWNEFVDKELS